MTDNKKQRKSARNFNMEKHVERHFDIEKEEIPVSGTNQGSNSDAQSGIDGNDNVNGSKKKIIAVIAVVVLVAIAFVAYRSCETNGSKSEESTNTVVSDSTEKEKTDTTSNVEKSVSPKNIQSQSNQTETSTGAESETEPANTLVDPTSASNDVEEKAMQVWNGAYGNGAERKTKLGSAYNAVQKRVNEMYRNGYRH